MSGVDSRRSEDTATSAGLRIAAPRLQIADRDSRVTTWELFFDLVYVFAFTQISRLMAELHTGWGVIQALIILSLLWWTWVGYAWIANRAPADQPFLRTGMTVAMIAVFIAALTIPEAYADFDGGLSGPLVFAAAYVVVRVTHIAIYLPAADGDRALRRQIGMMAVLSALPAGTAVVIGALVGGTAQAWIWAAAMIYDAVVTRLSSRGGGGWRLQSVAHWAERHGLIIILALGESVIAVGVGVAQEPVDTPIIAGTAVSIVISVLLWWSYFRKLAHYGEEALERRTGGARVALGRDAYSYVHFVIVAGIVVTALGIEEAMAHVSEREPFGWFGALALGCGIALYAAGTVVFALLVDLRRPFMRVVELIAALAAIPLLAVVPPLTALVISVVLMGVIAATESWLHRRAAASDNPLRREREEESA